VLQSGYMHPVWIQNRFVLIYSYTAALGAGLLTAYALTWWLARRDAWRAVDGLLWALAGAVVGGRIGYVWLQWDYFATRRHDWLQFSQGGLLYHGAVVGALLTLGVWCAWRSAPLGLIGDRLTPGAVVVAASGWWACWLEGCAYGRETYLAWYSADLPDAFGIFAVRYQTHALGLLLTGLVGVLLVVGWRRAAVGRGILFGVVVMALSGVHLIVGAWRGDPFPTWLGWRVDMWLDAALVGVGALTAGVATMVNRGTMIDAHRD
jgi:phosphatidylglycerol:prolipoprotein diacylglycerol transferase